MNPNQFHNFVKLKTPPPPNSTNKMYRYVIRRSRHFKQNIFYNIYMFLIQVAHSYATEEILYCY